MQQWRPESDAMTFDEASVERSKSFVKSLQVFPGPSLLSLPFRPPPDRIRSSHRLFLARVFCTYFTPHESVSVSVFVFVRLEDCGNLVLDNVKNYAGRALVNAVDHLGTVAYRLADLFEQQMLDVSTMEMKISCLNQVRCIV
ncbi:hypothetical protein B296_00030869 [Ensete ventricosum]|uniref:Uncharacterized protein n=1 Tax=Ensete ventricosum TaxID=4639 RepID=A0A426ZYC4_ENSVE|nr:hypothetical protein B296_00030869 [Ensete ventricosum]